MPDGLPPKKLAKLSLKGGEPWTGPKGVEKKPKKRKTKQAKDPREDEVAEMPTILGSDGKVIDPKSVSVQSGKTYEEEFSLQMAKAREGKVKNTPWGSSYKAPPEILHGYDRKVTGATAEERLDLRCAMKTDKFAK